MEFRLKHSILAVFLLWICSACNFSNKVAIAFESPTEAAKYFDNTAFVVVKMSLKGQIDSVVLHLNKEHHFVLKNNEVKIPTEKILLGENFLVAKAFQKGKCVEKKYTLFEMGTNSAPQKWSIKILEKLPHQTDAFTQGLFCYNGKLYETTGKNGFSRILKRDLESGKILDSKAIPNQYFGEGATVFKGKIYYLTWTSGKGFIFEPNTLENIDNFQYGKYTKEGWGLCSLEQHLVMSNGTNKLLFFNPQTMSVEKELSVNSNKGKTQMLNELEFDGNFIYANIWLTDKIAVINHRTGKLHALIDCHKLVNLEKKRGGNPEDDVLNGIAFNSKTNTFYLTGKNWGHIYRVAVIKY